MASKLDKILKKIDSDVGAWGNTLGDDGKAGVDKALKDYLNSLQPGGGGGFPPPDKIKVDPRLRTPMSKHDEDNNDNIRYNDPQHLLDQQQQRRAQHKRDQQKNNKNNNPRNNNQNNVDIDDIDDDDEDEYGDDFDWDDLDSTDDGQNGKSGKQGKDGKKQSDEPSQGFDDWKKHWSDKDLKNVGKALEASRISTALEEAIDKLEGILTPEEIQEAKDILKQFDQVIDDWANKRDVAITDEELEDLRNRALSFIDKAQVGTIIKNNKDRIEKINIENENTDDITSEIFDTVQSIENKKDIKKMKGRKGELNRIKDKAKASGSGAIDGHGINSLIDDIIRHAIGECLPESGTEFSVDTWAKSNRRAEERNLEQPGTKKLIDNSKPAKSDDRGPKITFKIYLDQTSSWTDSDVDKALKVLHALQELAEQPAYKDKIIIRDEDLLYFTTILTDSAEIARNTSGHGNSADAIVDDIFAEPKTTNVIIITDTDFDRDFGEPGNHGISQVPPRSGQGSWVDGCVWYVWKNNKSKINSIINGKCPGAVYGNSGTRFWTLV